MANEDGGPAFPVPNDANVNGQPGMKLWDWFAGMALQGELASQSEENGQWPNKSADALATRCYLIADAMLRAKKAVNDGDK